MFFKRHRRPGLWIVIQECWGVFVSDGEVQVSRLVKGEVISFLPRSTYYARIAAERAAEHLVDARELAGACL